MRIRDIIKYLPEKVSIVLGKNKYIDLSTEEMYFNNYSLLDEYVLAIESSNNQITIIL